MVYTPPMRQGRSFLWTMGVVLAMAASLRLADAAPQQAAPSCAWERLASGNRATQNGMIRVPGLGAMTFGGADLADKTVFSDVRRFDRTANSWQTLNVGGSGPGKRSEHAVVLRALASNPELITFGGVDDLPGAGGGGTLTWGSPLLAGGPAAFGAAGPFRASTVQDGAYRLVADAAAPTWQSISAGGKVQRTDHSAVWDPEADAMIVFGGRTDEDAKSSTDELRRLSLGANTAWQSLTPAGRRPSKRFGHSAVYDSGRKHMVLFGGTNDWKKGIGEVWSLDLSQGWDKAAWKELQPTGTGPSARFDHAAAYLPTLNWMIVFGGSPDGSRELADIFALDLAVDPPKWVKLNPTGQKPPALMGLSAVELDDGISALLQGGQNGEDSASQTYRLVCTPAALPTATTPPTSPATPTTVLTATATDAPPTATATAEPATATPPPPTATATAEPPPATPTSTPRPRIFLPWLERG